MPTPRRTVLEVVAANRRAIDQIVLAGLPAELSELLADADTELRRRLRKAHRSGLADRFTGAQAATTRALVRDAIMHARKRVSEMLGAGAKQTAGMGLRAAVETVRAGERQFSGLAWELPLRTAMRLDERVSGKLASQLRQSATSVDRYGVRMISQFERILRTGIAVRATTGELIDALVQHKGPKGIVSVAARELADGSVQRLREVASKEGIFVDSRYWAERIVRTETLRAYNQSAQETAEELLEEDFPDLQRVIVAFFDARTAADSVYVHGEVRGVNEPFEDGAGRVYLVPPARPNDREIVLPWREAWPMPKTLQPKPADVRAEAEKAAGGDK
jgi:predicted nucleic acid-binding protein